MEQFIGVLIYIHAAFGGIALISGLISITAKKGGLAHKKSGLIFFYAMLISGITAMVVALLPKHESPFLLAIGIFTLYFVLTGYRALRFKIKNPSLHVDKWISRIMLFTGILMIALPLIISKTINIILTVFAIIGIIFAIKDLVLYKNNKRLRKGWLKLHLGKMLGAYISATTAFIVVNQFIPSPYGWFIPGIIGGFIIAYWSIKINKSQKRVHTQIDKPQLTTTK